MQFTKSIDAFKRAQQSIPGGVNSPVRAFKASISIRYLSVKPKEQLLLILTEINILTFWLRGVL